MCCTLCCVAGCRVPYDLGSMTWGRMSGGLVLLTDHGCLCVIHGAVAGTTSDSAAHDRHIPGIHDHKSDDDASSDDRCGDGLCSAHTHTPTRRTTSVTQRMWVTVCMCTCCNSDITSAAEHEEQERMFARLLGEDMVRRRAHAIAAATNTPIPSDQDLYIDAASQQVAESRFSPKKVALGPSPMCTLLFQKPARLAQVLAGVRSHYHLPCTRLFV